MNNELVETNLYIPNTLTNIKNYTFLNCRNLFNVIIPDSVTNVGECAFYGCENLASVNVPNSVTSIGSYAFYNCTSLTSITIPDSVTSIGGNAFYNTGYYNNEDNWENGVLYISKHLIQAKTSISGSYTIKESTLTIVDYVFDSCTSLTSITIPDSVTSIGSNAFYDCSSLTSITIPDSVTSIGSYAFYDCSSLTSIIIPDSITSIGKSVFYNTGYYNNEDNWENGILYISKHLIAARTSISGSYTIKDGTLTITGEAFYYCSSLTSITIPDSVTSIGSNAFYICTNLGVVYYRGSEEDKRKISIGDYNTSLADATWCYNCCTESIEHTYDNGYDTECNICGFVRSAPKLAYRYSGTVVLVATEGYEYSCDGINWQTSNMFTDLLENTTYYFYQRPEFFSEKSNLSLAVTLKSSQATPDVPIVLGYSDTVVQLMKQSGMEYSLDGTLWQTSNIFRNLSPATSYTFYQRLAETGFSEASAPSNYTVFTTDKAEQKLIPAAPTVLAVTGTSVTLVPVEGCEYSKNGITWQSSNVFNYLSGSSEYTFYQRYKETETTYAGEKSEGLTVKTSKVAASRPSAPTLLSKTHNTVVLVVIDGYEYSCDGVNWQTSNVFSGLLPELNYMFYQRVAESEEYYASPTSASLKVKTDTAPIYKSGDIDGDEKVNLNDLVTIAQYIAGWNIAKTNNTAMDVNGDGTVDLQDVTHFAKYLAGWDVVLH